MINQQTLEQIKNFLNLEKISMVQKITIHILPKKEDDGFVIKLEQVKKDLKKISPNIYFEIMEEGEIVNVEQLEFSHESTGDGSPG